MQRTVIGELSQQKILRAAYSERQLEEVLVDFWFNHFNVFAGKGQVRIYLTEYERDAIRPHVLGKFRDLLGATAKSPAMLFYLDNWQSAAPEGAAAMADASAIEPRPSAAARPAAGRRRRPQVPACATADAGGRRCRRRQRRRGLNENYARELMELHTLGVDGGYTQKDVQEVARAFTGWTIAEPAAGRRLPCSIRGCTTTARRSCSGTAIKAGGGKRTASRCSTSSRAHPSTARFIATKLARRFVADEPPPALVDRAAATLHATPTATSARSCARSSPRRSSSRRRRTARKVKTPFEFVVSAVRATGADVVERAAARAGAARPRHAALRCQPPTGYADTADAWVNTGALLEPHELRRRADQRPDARRSVRPLAASPPTAEDARRALFAIALADDVERVDRRDRRESDDAGAGRGADPRLARIPETVGAHDVATHLPQERRAGAGQPRLRARVPRAHGGGGATRAARC